MADTKITALTAMLGSELAANDVFPVVDVSIPQTKKVTRTEFFRVVPEIQLESVSPALRFIESDGTAGFNTTRILRNADATSFQTLNGETLVSADYTMTADATGVIQHVWKIGNTEKLRIHSNGFIGVGVAAPLVSLDVIGDIQTRATMFVQQVTHTTKSAAATLLIAELLTKVILYTGGVATLTAPTGTNVIAGLPTSLTNNASFDFSIINTGAATVTLAANTDLTLQGSGAVLTATSGHFRLRKQNATTCIIYRMG